MSPNISKLIVCSMYRSGGTLIYNILKNIVVKNNLKFSVEKVHLDWNAQRKKWFCLDEDYKPEEELLFYSYRDIDEVIRSYCIRENFSSPEQLEKITCKKLNDWIPWIQQQDQLIRPFAHCFSYHLDIDSQELALQNRLEDILGVPRSLTSIFLRADMKKISDSLLSYDAETQLWPKHIS